MKSFLYSISIFLLLFSCADKSQKKAEVKEVGQKKAEIREPIINIPNLIYESTWDGTKNEGEYQDVFAKYINNRFEIPKNAISMDGIEDYAMIDNHDKINPENEISISIWYKPISFRGKGNDPVVYKSTPENEAPFVQYFIGVTGNEYTSNQGSIKFALSINGKYQFIQTKSNILTPNNWHNITGTYDGKSMQLYLNGETVTNRPINGKLDVFNTDLYIGKNNNNEINTPGSYDNLKIYNRALTKNEVLELSK